MGALVLRQNAERTYEFETGRKCEQPFATTVDAGDAFMVSQDESVVVLDTGATANLVCFRWLARHSRVLERHGIPWVSTYPPQRKIPLW